MRKFGKGNRAANWSCFLCGTKRPAAAAPTPKELADAKAEAIGEKPKPKGGPKDPQAAKAPADTPTKPSKRQLRRDARAKKKLLADEDWEGWIVWGSDNAVEAVAPTAVAAEAAAGDSPGTPAAKAAGASLDALPALSVAEKDRRRTLGLPMQAPPLTFNSRYPIPSKLVLATPKEAVAAALAGNASVKAASLKETVEKQAKAALGAAETFGAKHQITLLAQEELKKSKEELAAVEEHAPPAISKPAAQKIARACRKAQERHTERSQKDEAGMEKAEAKFTADVAALRKEIAGLEERIATVTSASLASQEAWRSRHLAIDAHEADVIREFRDQVALASPSGLEGDFLDEELPDISTVDEDLAKLKDLDLFAEDLAVEDIPNILLEGTSDSDAAILNSIGAFYLAAPVCVQLPAVTYTLLGLKDPMHAKTLVGDKVWSAIYQGKEVVASDWVPRQLVEILRCSMNNLASQHVKREDHPQAMVDAKLSLAQAKANMRSSPYSA